MIKCIYYAGNQCCDLHKSKVASAYCGDICSEKKTTDEYSTMIWPDMNTIMEDMDE